SRLRRERTAEVFEGGSFLHQVYENAGLERSLVLTLTPEERDIPEMVTPTAGLPVIFHVSLSRMTPEGPVSLEQDLLRTLEESPVSYSFRIAATPPGSSTPSSIGVTQVAHDASPAGSLPAGPAPAEGAGAEDE